MLNPRGRARVCASENSQKHAVVELGANACREWLAMSTKGMGGWRVSGVQSDG